MRDETSLAPTPAIVQTAVDLETTASAIDKILADVREGEAALHRASKVVDDWRCKAGALFAQVRRTLPASGPNARRWSEFVAARGISLDTAARYMKLAEHVAASPSETIAGKTVMDIYRELGIGAKPAGALEGAAAPAPAVAPPPVPSNQMALFGPALVAPPFAVPSAAQLPALGDPAPPAAEPSTSPRPLPTAKATPEDEAAERERAALAAVADLARMDAIEGTARAQGSLVMALRAHGGVPSGLMDTLHAAYAKFYEAERRKADLLDQPDTRPRSEPPAEVSEGDEDDDEDEDEDEEQDEEQDQGGEEERRRDEAQTAANVTRAQAEADEDEPCSVCGLDVCEDADACLAQAAKADGQADEDADAEEDAKPLPTPLTVLQGMVRHMTTDPARKEEVGAELLRLAGELGAVQVGELAREDLERLREVESQIGDRLRQVNGDGPCNPPNLVLALDLLIDAHRETMTEQEELLANLARLLNRWERIAPEDPTVDLRQLLAGRVDAAALTTANERDLTGALRIAERDLGRAEDRERVLYRALYRLASSWSVAPPADPRAALVAVLDSDEEIGRIAAASVRIEEEAQRTLGAVRDALESVAEALGIPPHGVAAAQLAQECCESIRQLSASPPQAARVLCEDPDCARYCDRPTDGGLALCDAHRPGAADARPVAEVLPALYWGTTWRDVGRSWAKPELRLPEISRWELDPEWIAATQLEHRAGLEWPVDLRPPEREELLAGIREGLASAPAAPPPAPAKEEGKRGRKRRDSAPAAAPAPEPAPAAAPWHQDPAQVDAALLAVLRYLRDDRRWLKIADGEGLSDPDLCERLHAAFNGSRIYAPRDPSRGRPRAELLAGLSRRIGGVYYAEGLRVNFGDDTDEGLGVEQIVLTLEGQPLVDAVRRVLGIPMAEISDTVRFLNLDFGPAPADQEDAPPAPAPKKGRGKDAAAAPCGAPGPDALVCVRPKGHAGKHAAGQDGAPVTWAAFAPPRTWEPASCGGAKAVHALAKDAVTGEEGSDESYPAALCGQRPSYKSKGWTPRPGTPLTCVKCQAASGAAP